MSLLKSVIVAHKCRSTHHRLVIDALDLLQTPDASVWRDAILTRHGALLKGAKAPDTTFKDFKNHVCHVSDGYWGGAPATAQSWYEQAVDAFKAGDVVAGVYAAGVMSHYIADPVQPFHTGQTEEEGDIHRAVEWSIAKSYDTCRTRLLSKFGGWPTVAVGTGPDAIADLVRAGAELSHPYYTLFIDHYDVDRGAKNPPEGLDEAMRDAVARLIGHAAGAIAAAFDRAISASGASAPASNLTVAGYLASLDVPIRWVTNKMADASEAATVAAMYKELKETGRVEKTLSDDDTEVRRLHAEEVLGVDVQSLRDKVKRATGQKYGAPDDDVVGAKSQAKTVTSPAQEPRPAPHERVAPTPRRRARLTLDCPVEDAPSIGPKTAARLEAIGVITVSDLLALDPERAAAALAVRHITPATLREWRAQADLVRLVPGLAGHDAQLLTACGITTPDALAGADAGRLFKDVDTFARSKRGQRVVRAGCEPTLDEVEEWIAAAQARTTAAVAVA